MISPTFRQVTCFLEVCRDFHFSQAAKRLGLAQPQLSRTIRELETAVGASLFFRAGRRVGLTASGEVFLKEVHPVPAILSRAVQGARRAAAGEDSVLRLGFVGALMGKDLLGVIDRFRREHPSTQLSLVDMAPVELLSQVASGELDGAFLGVRPQALPSGVRCVNWKDGAVNVCVARSHRLAERKRLKVEDLAGEVLVALSIALAPAYRDFVDGLYRSAGIAPGGVRETNGATAMASMVAAGCGVALLPASALRGMEAYVSAIPLSGPGTRLREVFVCSEEEDSTLAEFERCLGGEA